MQTIASSVCIRPPFLPRTPVRAADQALEACHSRQFTPPRALQAGVGRGKWGPGALHLRWTPFKVLPGPTTTTICLPYS